MSGQTASVTALPNHWCAISCTTRAGPRRAPHVVHRLGLGLERVADAAVVDHAAAAAERVAAVEARRRSRGSRPRAASRSNAAWLRASGRPPGRAGLPRRVDAAARRRRWSPSPGTAPSASPRASARSSCPPRVRFHSRRPLPIAVMPLGHRDLEVVGRLVLRVVVGRVPAGRALRLVDDERAVGGRHPALAGAVGVDRPAAGEPEYSTCDDERQAAAQPVARSDGQLLPGAREAARRGR